MHFQFLSALLKDALH